MISKPFKIFVLIAVFVIAAGASAYLAVTLFIKAEETVVVPALKDKDVVYALQMLSDLGLNTRIKASHFSTTIPANHIIAQDPAPGAEIKKGRSVKLVISRGPLAVMTPQLAGLPISQALILLEEQGLCPGTRAHTRHPAQRADTVIAQSPQAGIEINRNNCVDLLVSRGPHQEAFVMANLSTLPVDDAILKIETDHLVLGEITTATTQAVPRNTIARQTPPAGYRVVTGQTVDLGVKRVRSSVAANNGRPTRPPAWLFYYRTGTGFLNRHIKVRVNSKFFSYDLFDDFIPPTGELLFLIPRFENITVMLYEDGELMKTIFPGSRLTDTHWQQE